MKVMTLYQKPDSVNRCVFTCETIMPCFIPIRFETTEPLAFLNTALNKNKKNSKVSSDMESVPDP